MDMPVQKPLTESVITASLYFWWLAFLRSSKDYWWCCQQEGRCLDPRLVKVWQDFGDIFKYQCFMHWWQENGPKLFDSPQIEMQFDKYLESGMELLLAGDLLVARPDKLCIAIPLHLDEIIFIEAISQAWQIARIRGKHYDKDIKYRLFKLDLKGRKTIVPAYRAMVLNVCVQTCPPQEKIQKWGCFEMGQHLNLSPNSKITKSDSPENRRRKQNLVRTSFCQSKKTAAELIANVEIGKFPCKDFVAECERWTPAQQKSLDSAVRQGLWQPSNWAEQEFVFMLPNHAVHANLQTETKSVDILDSFASVEASFLKPKRVRVKKSAL